MQANLGAGGGGVVDMATGGMVDDSRGCGGGGGYSCQEDGDVRGQRTRGGGVRMWDASSGANRLAFLCLLREFCLCV